MHKIIIWQKIIKLLVAWAMALKDGIFILKKA